MTQLPLLMTGATGLVGSRFVELYGHRYEISNMDLTTGVDITNQETISSFISSHPAKTLIHLAAFTNTAQASKQEGDKSGLCYQVNVEGTRNIAQLCQKEGIHLIHVSTDFVFDGRKQAPYLEDDPTNPLDWYGKTKQLAEQVVQESGASYSIARIAYPYRQDFPDKPDLVKKIRAALESDTLPPQFTDSLITPTYVDDIATGFDRLISTHFQGIYHLVGSTSLSPYDLSCKVASHFGYDPQLVKRGSLAKYQETNPRPFAQYLSISNQKATTELELTFLGIDQGLNLLS